jgi:hypothetical protein
MALIDVNRGLAKNWELVDVQREVAPGEFVTERTLVGQPGAGVTHRLGPGGISIYMYNDDPGIFLNERGAPVSDHFAAMAGFDVEGLTRARQKKLAIAAGVKAVEDSFADVTSQNIIRERAGYRLVEIAKGHFAIHFIEADGKGSPLTSAALPEKAAQKLFDELAPEEKING